MVEDQHGAISGSLCPVSIWSKTNMKLSSGHCAPSSNGPGPTWSYLWVFVSCFQMVEGQHGAISGSLCLVLRWSKTNIKLSLGLCALSTDGPRPSWSYRWVFVPCLQMAQGHHEESLYLVFILSRANIKLSLGHRACLQMSHRASIKLSLDLCSLSSDGPGPTWSYRWVIVPYF